MARNLTVHSPPPLRSSTVAWPTHAATAVHAAATAQAVSLAAPVEGDGGGDAKVRRLRTVTRTVEARLSKVTVISSAAGTDCPALRWLLLLDGSGTVTPTKLRSWARRGSTGAGAAICTHEQNLNQSQVQSHGSGTAGGPATGRSVGIGVSYSR